MRKLEPPAVREPGSHARVLAQRRPALRDRAFLEALARRFNEYNEAAPRLGPLLPAAVEVAARAELLRSLYTSETERAERMRAAVRAVAPDVCPYCGKPGLPQTLDHILPRTTFPEFSLYTPNLVPCCGDCNRNKKEHVWDHDGVRYFLHPYVDEFLAHEYVRVTIAPDRTLGFAVPLFEFHFDGRGVGAEQRRTCESHFSRLRVTEALRSEFAHWLRGLRRRWLRRAVTGPVAPGAVRTELAAEEADERALRGVNTWRCLFLRAVIADEAVLTYVATAADIIPVDAVAGRA